MPPLGYRKRTRSDSPVPLPAKRARKAPAKKADATKTKVTLFDEVDAPTAKSGSLEENRKFLEELDRDESASSPSDVDSDDFEDVPAAKRQKTSHGKAGAARIGDDGSDDGMDWEDAIQPGSSNHATLAVGNDDDEIGDVSISLNEDGSYIEPLVSAATGKKGPSKRERHIRVQTHCLHVMSLMWHNTVRNSWLNDKEVQTILVGALPQGIKHQVDKWKRHVTGPHGVEVIELETKMANVKGKKGKRKAKTTGRDWTHAAESQAPDALQATGALLRALKSLASYWRKRFTITAPGIRKSGYKDLRRLRNDIKAWEKDKSNAEAHGERVETLQSFRKYAKAHEGSRDVGAQLFVALLRGLGMETRLVANLQPAGFGWSKAEEADPPRVKKQIPQIADPTDSDSEVEIKSSIPVKLDKASSKPRNMAGTRRKSSRGNKADPIDIDGSDSPLSDVLSDTELQDREDTSDDSSVVDVTPSAPRKKPHRKYDRDLAFPVYWAEVCDPVSHKIFPIDAMVLSTIASSDELLQTFEPRGKKAELSKQVICYTIAHSHDGTAKDVTIRYLKRHQLPGKTKGVRMPLEKVPVYNRKGKVKRYEDYDWFRTLISFYDRPEAQRTPADDLEDQSDLMAYKPAKEEKVVDRESLQGYKQSADFVLEQHLRREEALKPGSKRVRTFTAGKGDKAVEHNVYRRSDIVICKTVESWHKEGRAIRVGEQPLKYVPMRAVTLIRKREIEDAQRETGEKLKQGLYSQAQTDWIIPPPIENGVIPKNAFGNMDVYVPTMVPKGAVHLPLKGTAKLCRKLNIDYAEACTGFEFGKQRAVPVLTGVVVTNDNEQLVRDAWRAEQAEQRRKEDTKRTATALHWWRKMLLGLRVLDRMRVEYADAGGSGEEVNPFVLKARREGRSGEASRTIRVQGEDMSGGFLASEHDGDSKMRSHRAPDVTPEAVGDGGGYTQEGEDGSENGGGFVLEDEYKLATTRAIPKSQDAVLPMSLQSLHKDEDDSTGAAIAEEAKKHYPQSRRRIKGLTALDSRSSANSSRGKRTSHLPSDDEESSLSKISSDKDTDNASTSPDRTTSVAAPPEEADKSRRRSLPRVVISSRKAATPVTHRRAGAKAAKNAMPTRSPYFDPSDISDDEDEANQSDEEVVRPRLTTARTRARR